VCDVTDALVIGGAGFIGSHLVRRLLAGGGGRVTVYDNFSSGREWHLEPVASDPRLRVVRGDVKDLDALVDAAAGHDAVFLFASNPDIARAVTDPAIDFWEGTYLVQNTVEACRRSAVATLVYASGSGIYGDQGTRELDEAFGPLLPVSTYGAGKLAGEALVSAYCHLFGLRGVAFRFANIVGPRQTHGVVYDFVRKLLTDPTRLEVLGDGRQSKSYIHVDDVLDAVLMLAGDPPEPFDVFNAATEDSVTVREIAGLVVDAMGLDDVAMQFGDTAGGWKGDVPVVRLSSAKLRGRGWTNRYSSREALAASARALLEEAREEATVAAGRGEHGGDPS
jgi:UDP-glucose 4-epimerase